MNRVIHFEIPVTDTEKALEFYKKVLGGNFQVLVINNIGLLKPEKRINRE